MKKYYIITLIAIFTIAILQGYGIYLWYQNYVNTQIDIVRAKLNISIDEEYAIRAHKRHHPFKGGKQRLFYKIMTDEEVKKIAPPKDHIIKLKEVNVQDLRNRGIVETEADVFGLLSKDVVSLSGNDINLQRLSMIFKKNINKDFPYILYLLDENKNVIKHCGKEKDADSWQSCKPIAVGLKPLRFVSVRIKIAPSSFFKNSIATLLLSVSLALLVIFCVGYQMTIIRNKEMELKIRAISIHGTIHDLKSPLASVLLLLSFVKDEIKNSEQRSMLEKAEMQIRKLSNRIKTILLTAKANESKSLLNVEPTDIASLVSSSKELALSHFEDIRPSIIITDCRIEKVKVWVDRFLLENAIYNLIENAVKFSEIPAHVEIHIDENDKYVFISIIDQGIGIEKKQQKKMFNQFYRLPNTQSKNGYGIGLAMVRYTVKAHRGCIKVESEKGKGSTFTIILPLRNKVSKS